MDSDATIRNALLIRGANMEGADMDRLQVRRANLINQTVATAGACWVRRACQVDDESFLDWEESAAVSARRLEDEVEFRNPVTRDLERRRLLAECYES